MFSRHLMTLAAAGLLCGLTTLAYGARYATRFTDREGDTRSLHAESHTQYLKSTTVEGAQPQDTGVGFHFNWDAVEKVVSVRNGVSTFDYHQREGKATEEHIGAAAEKPTEETLYPMQFTYSRKASGEVTNVDTPIDRPGGILWFRGTNPLSPFQVLAYPFGHNLVFPGGSMKDGQTWTQTAVVEMRDDFPVEVSAVFKIDGKRKIDNRDLLQITGIMAGKRGPEARDWKNERGETVSGTYAGTVKGKIVYLFDPAAGAMQRVTTELASVQELKQPGKTVTLTDKLNTLLDYLPAGK